MALKPFEQKPDNKTTQDMVREDKFLLSLVYDWVRLTSAQYKHFDAKRRFIKKFEDGEITHWYEFWKTADKMKVELRAL